MEAVPRREFQPCAASAPPSAFQTLSDTAPRILQLLGPSLQPPVSMPLPSHHHHSGGPCVCSGTCFWAIILLSTEHARLIPRFPGSPKQASSLMLLPSKLHRHPTAVRVNSHDHSTALVQTYGRLVFPFVNHRTELWGEPEAARWLSRAGQPLSTSRGTLME